MTASDMAHPRYRRGRGVVDVSFRRIHCMVALHSVQCTPINLQCTCRRCFVGTTSPKCCPVVATRVWFSTKSTTTQRVLFGEQGPPFSTVASSDRPMFHERKTNGRPSLDRDTSTTSSSRLELVQKIFLAPFSHRKRDSTRILSDRTSHAPIQFCPLQELRALSTPSAVAPVIMTPRIIQSASSPSHGHVSNSSMAKSRMDFGTLGKTTLRLNLGSRRITSRDLQIVEATDKLLDTEVPEPDGLASNVSLLRGFNATIPSAEQGRSRRRQLRNVETPRLGLKKLGMSARGLMTENDNHEGQSAASEEDVVVVPPAGVGKKGKRRGRESLSTLKTLGKEELSRQAKEIQWDKENLHVKRVGFHLYFE